MQMKEDERIVMTLDAGGTNFVFTAIQGMEEVLNPIERPAEPHDLEVSLNNIVDGFRHVRKKLTAPPAAISFAFPGPADYKRGIIGNLGNLPAYKGGVALGPMLEDTFELPVFIKNDGDLFAYGEAIGGLLPEVNGWMQEADSPKRYNNLLGITLGTGIGAGIVSRGRLYEGDNSAAGEIWLMRHKLNREWNVEEGASIRAVRRFYAAETGIGIEDVPSPKQVYQIAEGMQEGDQAAAQKAYCKLGEVVGDALSNAITLLDGLIVIGGGLSGAYHLFASELLQEMNSHYAAPGGTSRSRLVMDVYNLENEQQRKQFSQGNQQEVQVPNTDRTMRYDAQKRTGIGITRLGTTKAISIGAYAVALRYLDHKST